MSSNLPRGPGHQVLRKRSALRGANVEPLAGDLPYDYQDEHDSQ